MPVTLSSGEYTPKLPGVPASGLPCVYWLTGTIVVPGSVAAVAVHTVPAGVAITKDVADVTLLIEYHPDGKVPAVTLMKMTCPTTGTSAFVARVTVKVFVVPTCAIEVNVVPAVSGAPAFVNSCVICPWYHRIAAARTVVVPTSVTAVSDSVGAATVVPAFVMMLNANTPPFDGF